VYPGRVLPSPMLSQGRPIFFVILIGMVNFMAFYNQVMSCTFLLEPW
jgi:hypothetical protein